MLDIATKSATLWKSSSLEGGRAVEGAGMECSYCWRNVFNEAEVFCLIYVVTRM